MLRVLHAPLSATPALTAIYITTAILAKMLDVYGAKMVNAERREILQAAVLSRMETVTLTAATSPIVDLAMLSLAATGAMM